MNLEIRLQNGRSVKAKTEEWLAALIVSLPPNALEALCERVEKRLTAYTTPGSYVLKAESGTFNVITPSRGGI